MVVLLIFRPQGLLQGEAVLMDPTGLLFYLVGFLIAGGIYAILCLALNVQWGYGGLFNAGIAGFFAVGAYASAHRHRRRRRRQRISAASHLPVPVGILAAALIAGITGWAVAKICVGSRATISPWPRSASPKSCAWSSSMRNG